MAYHAYPDDEMLAPADLEEIRLQQWVEFCEQLAQQAALFADYDELGDRQFWQDDDD